MLKPEFRKQSEIIEEIIRVNQAGEYGAVQIYDGQIEKIKDTRVKELMQNMLEGEKIHLSYFENQIRARSARPTIMLGLWKIIGRSLGKITSIYGTNLAMLITESVETTINTHYLEQLEYLNNIPEEGDLAVHIAKFREEELEHKDIAIKNGSQNAFCYKLLNNSVQYGCKIAISISKKI